jgi:hypothetical protein
MSSRLYALGLALPLFAGCGQSDFLVIGVASRGLIDSFTFEVRDISAIEDLGDFRGQQGVEGFNDGGCRAFVGGLGNVERPGDLVDGGVVTLEGASDFGADIVFTFDADQETYDDNIDGEFELFVPGDKLKLKGDGAGDLGGFKDAVFFPEDVTLLGDPFTIVRGEDALITWNEVDNRADQISFALAQGDTTILCAGADNGEFTIPGQATALLPGGGGNGAIFFQRVNGFDLLFDPDLVIDKLENGREVFLSAISTAVAGVVVEEP